MNEKSVRLNKSQTCEYLGLGFGCFGLGLFGLVWLGVLCIFDWLVGSFDWVMGFFDKASFPSFS